MKTVIGIDFGSDSARAILADPLGNVLNESVFVYPRWAQRRYCDASKNILRQHPADYLDAIQFLIPDVLKNQDKSLLAGIAVDATSSTVCAIDREGCPLALTRKFQDDPDAMFFLWKDHSAITEAEEINSAAAQWQDGDFREFSGSSYSCEWFWSKALYILRRNPAVAANTNSFIELGDWITALLCGNTLPENLKRSRCFAGHKAMWSEKWNGVPPEEFFAQFNPQLGKISGQYSKQTYTPDIPSGKICHAWAERFEIPFDVTIGGSLIDCHSGAIGAGIKEKELIKVIGTSSCDIVIAKNIRKAVPGICGQADGSVLPGYTGLEAGQAAFGDIFAWFKSILEYGGAKINLSELEKEAAKLAPGSSKLLCCDHFNGRRSPYADAGASGSITGLTLGATVPEIYRSLAESAVMGAKRIVDHFTANGIEINSIKAVGGISSKSPMIMQLFADILNMPVHISSATQACALGAAICASAAAKIYPDIETAMSKMSGKTAFTYTPNAENVRKYQDIYKQYLALTEN